MRKKSLIYVIIVIFIVISWFTYQKITDDTYEGMSIVPEQHKDIPLFKGLQPTEHQYIMAGNHWNDIYDYYLKQLPKFGWRLKYEDSLDDNDSENDWGGFNSRWRKAGFDGELWIYAHYNQFEAQTEVIFDKTPLHNATIWIDKLPESICIFQSSSNNNCTEIKDKTKIQEFARFINEAMDWNKDIEPRNQSKVIEFGNIEIKVLFESDKQIYLQSEKGIKLIKPEPDFLKLLNPVLR